VSITVANSAGNAAILTAAVGIAQRVAQGEWGWTWVAYLWGGILAFAIVGSALAGIFAGIGHLMSGDKRAREAREVRYDAHWFYLDSPGPKGPWNHATMRLVPGLSIVDVDYRLEALRAPVDAAVAELRRAVPPGAWVEQLPGLLSSVIAQGYVLRGPSGGFHYHDPGPSSPPPASAT